MKGSVVSDISRGAVPPLAAARHRQANDSSQQASLPRITPATIAPNMTTLDMVTAPAAMGVSLGPHKVGTFDLGKPRPGPAA